MKLGGHLGGMLSSASGRAEGTARASDRSARGSSSVRELDALLIWSALGLLLLGLVMVYSASIAIAEGSRFTGYQPYYFVMRHALFMCVGIFGGLCRRRLRDGRRWRLSRGLRHRLLIYRLLISQVEIEVERADIE